MMKPKYTRDDQHKAAQFYRGLPQEPPGGDG